MCGILGVLDLRGNRHVDRGTFRKMLRQIEYRGPDDEIIHESRHILLGMRRLRIIDLSKGLYPLTNERETLQLVFNGEIYNHRSLRARLEERGHIFRTNTDAEVIVHSYEENGVECLGNLRGMFAFALWDSEKERLFLCRDRLGKKPLFYHAGRDLFVFSSELKALLPLEAVPKELDKKSITLYTRFGYIPAPRTPFRGINKLEPAHLLLVDRIPKHIEKREYWDLAFRPARHDERFLTEGVMRLLEESVRLRLESDVPLGVFLSGGIDSSIVATLAARAIEDGRAGGSAGSRLHTFSVGFTEEKYDELSSARLVADRIRSDHTEITLVPEPETIPALLAKLAWLYNEPYADASAIPTYLLAQATKKHVTVALNGDGGDENFAGYRRYVQHMLSRHVRLPSTAPALAAGVSSGASRLGIGEKTIAGVARVAELLSKDHCGRFTAMQTYHEESALYHQPGDNSGFLQPYFDSQRDLLNRMLYTDIKTYLPYDLLVKVDIATMANSLEGRSPFLDHVFMEFCATIPPHLKLQGSDTKILLKKAAASLLPPEILRKPKHGFAVPVNEWLRKDLRFLLDTLLVEGSFFRQNEGLFKLAAIERMIERHLRGEDYGYRLWNLIMLDKWREAYKKYIIQ